MSRFREQFLLYKANTHKDPEAFAGLYDLYIKQIYQFIFLKVRRKEDAEDLTSQVFLKAWEYLVGTIPDGAKHTNPVGASPVRNFRAFIYELARNTVIDFYRQKERRESFLFEGEEKQLEALPAPDFVEEQVMDQSKKDLIKALDNLKEEYKEALTFRYIQGLSIKEIAQILNKSQIGVRVLIHRAMKALKKRLIE